MKSVYSAVRTGSLNKEGLRFVFKWLKADGTILAMLYNALVPTEFLRKAQQVSNISRGSVALFVRQKTFGPFIPVTYHSARSKYLQRRFPPPASQFRPEASTQPFAKTNVHDRRLPIRLAVPSIM
jgi:hypothetical protein